MDYIGDYWKILGAYASMWHLLCTTPLITYVVAHATSSHLAPSSGCGGRLIGRCNPFMSAPVATSPSMAGMLELKLSVSFATSARSLDILGCRTHANAISQCMDFAGACWCCGDMCSLARVAMRWVVMFGLVIGCHWYMLVHICKCKQHHDAFPNFP